MDTLRPWAAGWIAALVLCSGAMAADNKVVRLTSLDWPPYTSPSMQEQGASAAVARAAFGAMGYRLEIDFFPWSRAVKMAQHDSRYMGYFPEYYAPNQARTFVFSDAMGSGPLGFAQRTDAPITWHTIDDLARYRIGVVQDYVNTEEFDQRVAKGQLKVDVTMNDLLNLRKLANQRIDLAIIDRNVMNHLLHSESSLTAAKGKIQFNAKMLENKKLYICFKRSAEGENLSKVFNAGLKKIDVDAIMARHLK